VTYSEELTGYIRAIAEARGIPVDEKWLPGIELHLKRLLDAAALLDKSGLKSQDLAPRFEP
jgi:hypothetical protein